MAATEPVLYAEPWRADAVCAAPDVDPAIFFPDKTGRPQDAKRKVAAAKALCATCEVTSECLAFALEHHERFGVWGGKTPGERKPKPRPDRFGRRGLCRWCGLILVVLHNPCGVPY